jgi:uncharacterized protein
MVDQPDFVALTLRRLKLVAYDAWRTAWHDPDDPDALWVDQESKAYIVRNVEDPDEVVAFGSSTARARSYCPYATILRRDGSRRARAMAERGYGALAFDYRYFGESGGEPRQFENPAANIEDIGNAASALLADDRLTGLPVFGLGICFGAGPMVSAVRGDARFRAFAGVAGVYTDNAKTAAAMGAEYHAKIDRGLAAERKWNETGECEVIPAVASDGGDVAMPLREAYEFYGTPRGAVPNYVNGYAVQSLAYSLPFDARGAAGAIEVPVLIVHSNNALAPALARDSIRT